MNLSKIRISTAALTFILFAFWLATPTQAQSNRVAPTPPQPIPDESPQPSPSPRPKSAMTPEKAADLSGPVIDEKSTQILQLATDALGGSAYLNINTVTSRGMYTVYKEGKPGLPLTFIDYIVYPDKERTEFRGDGTKVIQINDGETGWIYDGMVKSLKDLKPAQVADFKQAMRTSIDNLLRGMWRKDGAKIRYAGRREAGVGKRNEAVRVIYPDGFAVEFEFGAQDHLPAKMVFTKTNPEDGEEIREEDHMAKYIQNGGIRAPYVIDHYRAGVQSSSINYESIQFNAPVADNLFARPANAKAVK
jgi:hypothetical protein